MDIANLSAKQLRRAADIKDHLDKLNAELSRVMGSSTPPVETPARRGPRKTSAAARARIAAAQRARWARRQGESAEAPKPARRPMSAAAKARIAAAAKARWAKAKALGKTSLKGV